MVKRTTRLAVVAMTALAMLTAGVATAAPAQAKNNCGPIGLTRSGPIGGTGRITQSCDSGTQASYTVHCVIGQTQYTRYFAQSQTAIISVACPGGGSTPIKSVEVEYS